VTRGYSRYVHSDFYTTIAQVFPLLLLALVWDSAYLARLRKQPRPLRATGTAGVLFWTKPRVRVYTLFVAGIVIASTGVTLLVLGGMIPDSFPLRVVLVCALVIELGTVLTRIFVDVITSTASATGELPLDSEGVEE
jgi:hypothetical protein